MQAVLLFSDKFFITHKFHNSNDDSKICIYIYIYNPIYNPYRYIMNFIIMTLFAFILC